MAGKYIEFVNPGYSTLYTRDLKYLPSSAGSYGESSSINVFDPDSANPLVEGEWLQYTADNKLSRVYSSSSIAAAAGANVSTVACAMHFSEKGRYDAQITKKAHVVSGPNGFDFKTKLCLVDSSVAAGTRLFVADFAVGSEFKRGLYDATSLQGTSAHVAFAVATSGATIENADYYWSPGYVQRYIGTGEVVVHFDPQLILCIRS